MHLGPPIPQANITVTIWPENHLYGTSSSAPVALTWSNYPIPIGAPLVGNPSRRTWGSGASLARVQDSFGGL